MISNPYTPRMIVKFTVLVYLVLFLVLASNVTAQTASDSQRPPLKLETIERLVKARTDAIVIVGEITDNGIDFFPSDPALERLRKLGAPGSVIQALREKRQRIPTTTRRVRLVVAEFKPVGTTGKPITETLVEQLRDAVKPYSDVEILAPEITITAQQGSEIAKERAKQYNAQIIIWGWYSTQNDTVYVTVHFDVLEAPQNLALVNDKKTLPIPIGTMEGFNVQIVTPLSSEMSYLTLLTLAFARLEAQDFDGAIGAFTKTLSLKKVPDSMINPVDVYLGRAVAHMSKSSLLLIDENELAMADLNTAVALDPECSAAHAQLCGIYADRGETQKALSHCNKALTIDPGDYLALMQRGRTYVGSGDLDSASADFRSLLNAVSISKQLNEIQKLALSSVARFLIGDTEAALKEITKAIELAKSDAAYAQLLLIKTLIHGASDNAQAAIETASEGLRTRPDLVLFYLFRSAAYVDLKNYSGALKDIDTLIGISPTLALAYVLRGEIHWERDDPASAMKDYGRSLELDPTLGMAYTGRGRSHMSLKEYDKAIADFDLALSAKRNDKSAYLYRGRAFVRKKDYSRAIEDYDRYLKLFPSEAFGFASRALLYELQGQLDNALADYDRAISLNQNDADLFFWRGELLEKRTEHKRAIADFDRVLKLNPSYPDAYLNRGTAQFLAGNIDNAIRDYDEVVAAKPSDATGYLYRAAARKAKGQLDEALLDYTRAIELRPDFALSYKQRAEIFYKRKAVDQAIADYSKALQLHPDAEVHRQRGFAYFDKANWKAAIYDFERARELDPRNPTSLALALSYEGIGDFRKAMTFFDEYVAKRPTDSRAYSIRGNAFRRSKAWNSALVDYTKAIELKSEDDLLFFNRGTVFEKLGQMESALIDYNEAIKLNSKTAEYFFRRAVLQFNSRNLPLAVTDLSTAIKLDPNEPNYYYIRGLMYSRETKYEPAIDDFTAALRIKSDWDEVLLERATSYFATGNRHRGRADLLKCLKVTRSASIKEKAQKMILQNPSRTRRK